jgi:hypothetical protein
MTTQMIQRSHSGDRVVWMTGRIGSQEGGKAGRVAAVVRVVKVTITATLGSTRLKKEAGSKQVNDDEAIAPSIFKVPPSLDRIPQRFPTRSWTRMADRCHETLAARNTRRTTTRSSRKETRVPSNSKRPKVNQSNQLHPLSVGD